MRGETVKFERWLHCYRDGLIHHRVCCVP